MLSKYIAITGRVNEYLEDIKNGGEVDKRVFPASCTVYVYDNNLQDLLHFTSAALRKGAGVKIQLENFKERDINNKSTWYFTLDAHHADYDKLCSLPNEIRQHFVNQFDIFGLAPEILEEHSGYRIIKVNDSMEEDEGTKVSIEKSWLHFFEALESGYVPIVDLSALRPAGTASSNRLVATGALGMGDTVDKEAGSFVSIYYRLAHHFANGDIISLMQLLGQLNRTIRQGRYRKTGIVCTALHYRHPDIKRYLRYPLSELIGSQKKGIRIDEGVLEDKTLVNIIAAKVNSESLFLEKIQGNGLYSNVCVEILLKHKGTCLLSHANGGALEKPEDIPEALCEVTKFLAEHWCTWRDKVSKKAQDIFLPLDQDKQIGVGWIGWANFLAHMKVRYRSFGEALKALLDNLESGKLAYSDLKSFILDDASAIAVNLFIGYSRAATIGASFGLERIFTMAPTQTVAYRYKDLYGYTCSRSIDPPFTRRVRRNSDRIGSEWHYHGKNIEIASEVGAEVHELVWTQWMRMLRMIGYAHTMSYDHWSYLTPETFKNFMDSELQTSYYNFAGLLDQSYLNKGIAAVAVDKIEEPTTIQCACAE